MKANAKISLLTFTIFLTGCASAPQQHWFHQTKNQQQFYQDNSQCTSMANSGGNMYQNVPPSGQTIDSSGLQNTLGQIGDQNRRADIQRQCMYGKGWSLRTSEATSRSNKRHKWSHWSKRSTEFATDSAACRRNSGSYDGCLKNKGWYSVYY